MLGRMNLLLTSFWRALGLCLLPRVLLLSLLPLALLVALALLCGHFYWLPALSLVQDWLDHWPWLNTALSWLGWQPGQLLKSLLAGLLLLLLVTPLLALLCVMVVSLLLTPLMSRLVAQRYFPTLEPRHGSTFAGSLLWACWSTLLALGALLLSMPLWLIPPLLLVLPPLIWGWLSYRIMSYDALAEHASRDERVALMREHRLWLLSIGTLCGLLGALPAMVWGCGLLFAFTFIFMIPLAMWLYTVIFAFSGLWVANYALAALQHKRQQTLRDAAPRQLPASASISR
jgi:hypothetical protein